MHGWYYSYYGQKGEKQQELTGIEGRSWVLIAGKRVGRRELDGVQERNAGTAGREEGRKQDQSDSNQPNCEQVCTSELTK